MISELSIDGGSSDNCSGVTLSISQMTFGCADIQTNPNIVTLMVKCERHANKLRFKRQSDCFTNNLLSVFLVEMAALEHLIPLIY
jgi:hypothetical protein